MGALNCPTDIVERALLETLFNLIKNWPGNYFSEDRKVLKIKLSNKMVEVLLNFELNCQELLRKE